MGFTQRPLRPIEVDCTCDYCETGMMRPTGIMHLSSPPQFPHECNNCGAKKTFYEKYPTIRYVLEGELLDPTAFADGR